MTLHLLSIIASNQYVPEIAVLDATLLPIFPFLFSVGAKLVVVTVAMV